MRTQVGIVGAGPAGLLLGHLLHLEGIESVIVENRSRDYVVERVRAGVLEQGTADLLTETGLGERLRREGLRHHGIYLTFAGRRHRVDFEELAGGRSITIYGQNEVVKDLIAARLATGRPLHFGADGVAVSNLEARPEIRFRLDGEEQSVECDILAGCDGFHGICRPAIPVDRWQGLERVYPLGWLGILAEASPSSSELVYALHENGFALFSMRSERVTRLYLQCAPDERLEDWSDDRIWAELQMRLGCLDGWRPNPGPILKKDVSGLRGFVAEPMQYGRLFLAGDAAHIVPPTGAKGLNLAVRDVQVLARAIAAFYREGRKDLLDGYSEQCLRYVWKVQRFTSWMTALLHRPPGANAFDYRCQLEELDQLVRSRAMMTMLAENYVGAIG
jgi:p-hydroxybenzoate 3-monooxygenase